MNDFSPIFAALIAFLLSAVSGTVVVPFLNKLHFGQTIREEGPAWHQKKSGTPTMGGIMIIFSVVVSLIIICVYSLSVRGRIALEMRNPYSASLFFAGVGLALGMGIVGFIDDYLKVVKKRNLGLTAKQKTILQCIVTLGYLITLALSGMNETWLPFVGYISVNSGLGLLFWPIAFFFIYGFTNAVNLTDGVDGLATSVTLVVSCAFMLMSGYLGMYLLDSFSSALAGALIGFLIWNSHPAKVFMGDTGSLFLGGAVVAFSFTIERPIILILAGIVYLIEAFSVILQVAYYKKTKKRLFKMSPIHHHFELSGWSENKIVFVFSLVSLIAGFLSALPIIL